MNKSDTEIVSRLKVLRGKENEIVIETLELLSEVLRRKTYLSLSYTSLYEFTCKEIGLDKNEAHLRARATEAFVLCPSFASEICEGRLSLTSLMLAQVSFRAEDHRRAKLKLEKLSCSEKITVIQRIAGYSAVGAKRILADAFPELRKDNESTRALKNGRTQIHFGADAELMGDFARLKELLAHKNFEGKWEPMFKEIAKIALEQLDPKLKKQRKPKSAAQTDAPDVRTEKQKPADQTDAQLGWPETRAETRAETQAETQPETRPSCSNRKCISVHVRRRALATAAYRCQFIDPTTGRRCDCTHALQLDHRVPLALGGTNEIGNLRILCGSHNRWMAERMGLNGKTNKRRSQETLKIDPQVPKT